MAAPSFYAEEKLWVLRTSGLPLPSTSRGPQLCPGCPVQWSQSWPPRRCPAHRRPCPQCPRQHPLGWLTAGAAHASCPWSVGANLALSLTQTLQTLPGDGPTGTAGLSVPWAWPRSPKLPGRGDTAQAIAQGPPTLGVMLGCGLPESPASLRVRASVARPARGDLRAPRVSPIPLRFPELVGSLGKQTGEQKLPFPACSGPPEGSGHTLPRVLDHPAGLRGSPAPTCTHVCSHM